jgi:hypothetical protein
MSDPGEPEQPGEPAPPADVGADLARIRTRIRALAVALAGLNHRFRALDRDIQQHQDERTRNRGPYG